MTAADTNAYSQGRQYLYAKKLSAGTDYSYYFEALDANSGAATGAPTTAVDAPDVVVSSDLEPPSLAITSPVEGQIINDAAITVAGTASDNVEVEKVEIKISDSNWQRVSGTNSWHKEVTLAAETNLISARATDTSGNTKEVSITVTYRVEKQDIPNQKIAVYPNPYIKGKASSSKMTFLNLGKGAVIKIYNTGGQLIKELSANSNGETEWDVNEVSIGVYLYVVTSPSGVKKGKVSVVK